MREFLITKDHLKLLKHTFVEYDDTCSGAPYIDPKRPYGNSQVIEDLVEILGFEDKSNNEENENLEERSIEERIGSENYDYLMQIHRELDIVLQICLWTQSFKPGLYIKKRDWDEHSWKYIGKK